MLRDLFESIESLFITPEDIEAVLGLDPHEINEPSEKCKIILEEVGLTKAVCEDFRAIRRWVACRAWQLLEEGKYHRWRDAIRKAWQEARLGCAKQGAVI